MKRDSLFVMVGLLLLGCSAVAWGADAYNWHASIEPMERELSRAHVGALSGSTDGYDGQQPYSMPYPDGIAILHYRQNSSRWSGPTGFYSIDYQSPTPSGGSKTWSDIYLWSQNYTPLQGDRVNALVSGELPGVPAGYMARLVLDYVPESLNWTGPTDYYFPLTVSQMITLPVPTVSDPLQGVRMHLTVYAPPVPEPSSLLGLAAGLSAFAGVGLRRRRR